MYKNKVIKRVQTRNFVNFEDLLLTTVLMDRMRLRACDFMVGGSNTFC